MSRALRPVNQAVSRKVRVHQREGRVVGVVGAIQPAFAATALVGMLERVGVYRLNYDRSGL